MTYCCNRQLGVPIDTPSTYEYRKILEQVKEQAEIVKQYVDLIDDKLDEEDKRLLDLYIGRVEKAVEDAEEYANEAKQSALGVESEVANAKASEEKALEYKNSAEASAQASESAKEEINGYAQQAQASAQTAQNTLVDIDAKVARAEAAAVKAETAETNTQQLYNEIDNLFDVILGE